MKHPIERLTARQRDDVLKYLPTGGDRVSVCDVVGVTPVQLRLEMKHDPAFAEAVVRAEGRVELIQMGKILKATDDEKNWRTSVWWIERRTRERRRTEGPVSEDKLLELVDALAQALAEEFPDSEHVRRAIERLFAVVARDAADPVAAAVPSNLPLLPSPQPTSMP